jgi:anti-sigma factor RsiW
MKNDPLYDRLRESSWKRKLSATETAELRAWLAAHPDARTDWADESALTDTLGRLANAPVPSNFTARVLAAIEREAVAESRQVRLKWQGWHWRLRWLTRGAFAALVLGAGLFSYYQVQAAKQRAEFARSVAAVSGVSSLPSPEILKDFDAIYVLNQTPAADEELLALLK